MKDKINVAELLRNYPSGMKLDCTTFNNVTFQCVDNDGIWIGYIDSDNNNRVIHLTCYGGIKIKNIETKCIIFPKGKTTWEGFVPPCQFKNGDVIAMENECGIHIFIYNHITDEYGGYGYYVILTSRGNFKINKFCSGSTYRFATEGEKGKLFQAIKDNGYRWNNETRTLEKLVEPKFRVGDIVQYITDSTDRRKIEEIDTLCNMYHTDSLPIMFEIEDEWKLVSDKFDITTLKPFESKVLVRNDKHQYWIPAFWGFKKERGYSTTFGWCRYCIPYKGNEHLLGTTNDCKEYFKT